MAPAPEDFSGLWSLGPAVTFLNHGSFGACPIKILEAQDRYRRQLEAEPVQFFLSELGAALHRALPELATFCDRHPSPLPDRVAIEVQTTSRNGSCKHHCSA